MGVGFSDLVVVGLGVGLAGGLVVVILGVGFLNFGYGGGVVVKFQVK